MKDFFNNYVKEVFPERRAAAARDWRWPGDEWADASLKAATWRWVAEGLPPHVRHVVELGPGSGKYTELLLRETAASVVAFEISDAFIESLEKRCAAFVSDGRLDARLIDWTDNEGLLRSYADKAGTADVFLAVDVLLMMDFQSAVVYLIAAGSLLRPGGRLLATFADGGSDSGFDRMVRDAGRHSASDFAPCTRFHWVNQSLLETVLPRLGFGRVDVVHGPDKGLDIARIYLTAELTDPGVARALASALAPAGDSTNRRTSPIS